MTPPADTERYKNHRFPGEIISHGVWLYYRFTLSCRDVQELLFERGIDVSHEAIRQWCRKFGQDYANRLRRRRPQPGDKWHLEIVFAQLTKMSGLAAGSCWDGIPDFDIAIGNQHSINQEFHQGPLLRKCSLGSTALDPLAKGCDGRHHASKLAMPIDLPLQLLVLGCQGLLFLFQLQASSLILR
jgi:hypothetical protein